MSVIPMSRMHNMVPRVDAIADSLGITSEMQKSLRSIAYVTIERMWRWNWVAAGLYAGTLKVEDMFYDLVTAAQVYVHENSPEDPMEAISAVVPAWSSAQVQISDVYYKGSGNNRRAYCARYVERDDSLVESGDDGVSRMLDRLTAEQEVARIREILTPEEFNVMEVYAREGTQKKAAVVLGVHDKTVFRWIRDIRKKLNAKAMRPTTRPLTPRAPHVPKTCSIDGCGKVAAARSWCKTHWGRWSRHGDPTKVLQVHKLKMSDQGSAGLPAEASS